jgi:Spy/CpxP family protein refolding chaperone
MSKLRIIVTVVFLLVFGAGIVVGMVQSRVTGIPHAGGSGEGHIDQELGLSPAQAEKMKQIWSPMGDLRREHDEKMKRAAAARDERIKGLLSPDQVAAFEKVKGEYDATVEQLRAQRRQTVEGCIQQTRAILSPEQAEKYEQMLERRKAHWKAKEQ